MAGEGPAFDRAFQGRSDRLSIRPERAEDLPFVRGLAERCSPLADVLPAQLLAQQAAAQEASHRSEYPSAMRRIVSANGIPVGRIVIEWRSDGVTHGVDIAVLPEFRSSGAGLQMLRAWLDVADSMESLSTLYVRSNNPVLALYRRLSRFESGSGRRRRGISPDVQASRRSGCCRCRESAGGLANYPKSRDVPTVHHPPGTSQGIKCGR